MKKLLTTLCVLALALVCVLAFPAQVDACCESDWCDEDGWWEDWDESAKVGNLDLVPGKFNFENGDFYADAKVKKYSVTETKSGKVYSGICGEELIWTLDPSGLLTISGSGVMYDYGGEDEFEGFYAYPSWVKFENSIKNIVIESGVTCIDLEAVLWAFGEEGGNLTIPASVTWVERGLFSFDDDYCGGSINHIYIEDLSALWSGRYDGIESGELHLLGSDGKEVTAIALDDTLTKIPAHAFQWFKNITSVAIPSSVTEIGEYAFYGCSNLKSITIPGSVKTIGKYAFDGCKKLSSAVIEKGVTSIDERAFRCCTSLENIVIPDSVTNIGQSVFSKCTKLNKVTIGKGLKSISPYMFYKCTALENIIIPGNITKIENSAFSNCRQLKSITVGDKVTSIGDNAFRDCVELRSVALGSKIKKIGSGAFFGCTKLTSITIPDRVTKIENDTFKGNSTLKSVTLGKNVKTIGLSAFEKCTKLTSITVPSSVTTINSSAFSGCAGLKTVVLGSKVKTIGENAFYNCKRMTSVTLPKSVKKIGKNAFEVCINLENVYYNGTKSQKTDINIGAGNSYLFAAKWSQRLSRPNADGSVSASSGKPVIKWKKVSGAAKYEIYRATSKSGTYKKIATTTKTSYTDKSAKLGKTYYYKVRAVSAKSSVAKSAFSSVQKLTVICARPNVTVKLNSTKKPVLKWNDVSGAKKYQVYVATSKGGKYKLLTTTSKETYTHKKAAKGKTYYYKVRAVSSKNVKGNFSAIDRIKVK